MLSIKIELKKRLLDVNSEEQSILIRTMQFDGNMIIYDVINIINEKFGELGGGQDHGLFKPSTGNDKESVWLNEGRTLNSYDMKNGELLEFKKKSRTLRVCLMDGSEKVVLVDESSKVSQLIRIVCEKVGLSNPLEFGFTSSGNLKKKDEFEGIYEQSKKERKEKVKEDEKIQKLSKKVHAENEINWLNPEKTLREQGIGLQDKVFLRKKYYFHDQQLDSNNQVLINLIYVQANEDILDGKHPCSIEEAIMFAGLQAHIENGVFNPDVHKTGFLKLERYLPEEYSKDRSTEKKILLEYRKNTPLTANDAKYRYIQLCRALKTYGTTFFLVKESVKGKQKLNPVLLGVSRDSVIKADQETKRIMVTWKLSQVLRWAAGPNHFTLDFGDDRPRYTVQTTEGEAISNLISGYVDFHVDKKYDASYAIPGETDGGITNIESVEGVLPSYIQKNAYGAQSMKREYNNRVGYIPNEAKNSKSHYLALQDSSISSFFFDYSSSHYLVEKSNTGALVPGREGKYGRYIEDSEQEYFVASQTLVGNIQAGTTSLNNVLAELNSPESFPPMGNDPSYLAWKKQTQDIKASNVASQLAALSANVANILMLNSGKQDAQTMLGKSSAVSGITGSIGNMSKDIRRLAGLSDNEKDQENLLASCRELTDASTKIFQYCQVESDKLPTAEFYKTADQVYASVIELLGALPLEIEINERTINEIQELCKQVMLETKEMFKSSIEGAVKVESGEAQKAIRTTADSMVAAAVSFGKATKVLSPTINNLQCQDALLQCATLLINTVNSLSDTCQKEIFDKKVSSTISAKGVDVKEAISQVIKKAKTAGIDVDSKKEKDVDELAKQVVLKNPNEIAGMKREIDDLLNQIIKSSDGKDSEKLKKLCENAKTTLKNATASQIDASNKEATLILKEAHIKKCLRDLEIAAKKAALVLSQLVSASNNAQSSNRNSASKQQIADNLHKVRECINELAPVIKNYSIDGNNPENQLALISESKKIISPSERLIASNKVAVNSVGDKAVAKQIENFSKASTIALKDLRLAQVEAADALSGLELDAAIYKIKNLIKNVNESKNSARKNSINPFPGQDDPEICIIEIATVSKTIGSSIAQMCSSVLKENEKATSVSAKEISSSLEVLFQSCHGLAALGFVPLSISTTKIVGTAPPEETLESCSKVLSSSCALVETSKALLENHEPDSKKKLEKLIVDIRTSLQDLIHQLPGQRNLTEALHSIVNASNRLANIKKNQNQISATTTETEASTLFSKNIEAFRDSLNNITSNSHKSMEQISDAFIKHDKAFKNLISSGEQFSATSSEDVKEEILTNLNDICTSSTKLVNSLQGILIDPQSSSSKQNLAYAARELRKLLDDLAAVTSTSAPGIRECESGLQELNMLSNILDTTDFPINDMTYTECLEAIKKEIDQLSKVSEKISKVSPAQSVEIVNYAKASPKIMEKITDYSVQAIYLIGISDSNSTPAVVAAVDLQSVDSLFHKCNAAVEKILNATTIQEIVTSATDLKNSSQEICILFNDAASKATDPALKQAFMDTRKAIAGCIKEESLFQKVKAHGANLNSQKEKGECEVVCNHLLSIMKNAKDLANSPQCKPVHAVMTPEAIVRQNQIKKEAKKAIQKEIEELEAIKQIATDVDDKRKHSSFQQAKTQRERAFSNYLKVLNENAPGTKECNAATLVLQQTQFDLENALISIESSNTLPTRGDNDMEGFQEMMLAAIQDSEAAAEDIQSAALNQNQTLGPRVSDFANSLLSLTASCLGTASKIGNKEIKRDFVSKTKKLTDNGIKLINEASKVNASMGEKNEYELEQALNEFRLDAQDLSRRLVASVGDTGALTTIISQLERSTATTSIPPDNTTNLSFMDSINELSKNNKQLVKIIPSIAQVHPEKIVKFFQDNNIVSMFNGISQNVRNAVATADNEEVKTLLKSSSVALGNSLVQLVHSAKAYYNSPNDYDTKKCLLQSIQAVLADTNNLNYSVYACTKALHSCDQTIQTLDGLASDLNTTSIFANAGSLVGDKQNCDINQLVTDLADVAKSVKNLAKSANSSQETIGTELTKIAKKCEVLVGNAKENASGLKEDQSSQVLLLNGAKDFIDCTDSFLKTFKPAIGKSNDSSHVKRLIRFYENEFKSSSLAYGKIIKSLENELARGIRATEAASEAIKSELSNYDNIEAISCTPENMLLASKRVTDATTNLIAAVNSKQKDKITNCSNNTRKAVINFLRSTKGACKDSKANQVDIERVTSTAKTAAKDVVDILDSGVLPQLTSGNNTELVKLSTQLANTLNEMTRSTRKLKGSDLVDPDDPQVIAEKELKIAAAMIEEAALKLANLQPKENFVLNDDMKFEELIVSSAQQVTSAISALISAAQRAQKEISAKEAKRGYSPKSNRYHENNTWSEGLVSAAKEVGGALNILCEAANSHVKGEPDSNFLLIASSKGVSSATQRLLLAALPKSDLHSKEMIGLSDAGNAVIKATNSLVEAAQKANSGQSIVKKEIEAMKNKLGAEMNLQVKILQREKDVETARNELERFRKMQYQKK